MATNAEKPIVYAVIREMIAANHNVLNADIAEEASRRLGKPVSRSEISKLRGDIGLNMFQMVEREANARFLQAAREIVKPYTKVSATAIEAPQPQAKPGAHTALKKINRQYRDVLARWAWYAASDIEDAARSGTGLVTLHLTDLPFEPEAIYACLWLASNLGVEVNFLPSQPDPS